MTQLKDAAIWDYQISKKDLQDPRVLKWYLQRKAKMADWQELDKKLLLEHLDELNISPYRKKAIRIFFGR